MNILYIDAKGYVLRIQKGVKLSFLRMTQKKSNDYRAIYKVLQWGCSDELKKVPNAAWERISDMPTREGRAGAKSWETGPINWRRE